MSTETAAVFGRELTDQAPHQLDKERALSQVQVHDATSLKPLTRRVCVNTCCARAGTIGEELGGVVESPLPLREPPPGGVSKMRLRLGGLQREALESLAELVQCTCRSEPLRQHQHP